MTDTLKSGKLELLEAERERLRVSLENEFRFFSATDEFREGSLASTIAMMRRYDTIERYLKRHRDQVFSPTTETLPITDPPPVEGDTLHFSPGND